ncbi:Methyltransferase domain-containing protein [Chitinophaga costaii]|uniref:Methyltransferase domain-containing protein n=1 Tax=Chitinophaga costaii TaxID=1335309 RepID=A0A1C4E0Z9_9BACT|nr:methyltransferase domain-containing protein [Chitinophaga costaii]PUZ24381.1 methyltransferase domain-containing protein [Chitinophaga costaii]SCC37286.1 Methyltransferase domain-containing protein [Chitinophaga costaii]
MSLRHRSYEKELLDHPDIPFADIQRNMQELNQVNTLLGGHAVSRRGLATLLDQAAPPTSPVTIAEIGCGGGDNLFALQQWLHGRNIPFELTGIDLKPECITYAHTQYGQVMKATWICSDYRQVQWETPPDIIFSSLFCHHFTDAEMVAQLQWLQQHSRRGFFINDLHRHWLAYHSIRLLTRLFSKSYLVKNDAPLSVKRGFSRADWQRLLGQAGITGYRIRWQWAFRYLITVPS